MSTATLVRPSGARDAAAAPPAQARLVGVATSWWPLLLVLVLQSVVALTTLHNTAFQDEGLYLYAGRQLWQYWLGGPAPVEHYAYYFSGYPYIYSAIGGALDMLGGVELARLFSLACMLGVTSLVYVCTRRLFEPTVAMLAATAYAFLGTVLFLSRLATFDALCLLLIALSTAFALRAARDRRLWPSLTLGPLIVLSILTKYAALLFVPAALGVLLFASLMFQGWRRTLPRVVAAGLSLGVSVVVAILFMDSFAFHAIAGSTTARVPGLEAPRLAMFEHVLYMGGAVYGLALVGLVLVFQKQPRLRMVALVLFGSSLLIPAYHIYKQEAISFDKHLAYAFFFAMPLAGYGIAWLGGLLRRGVSNAPTYHGLPALAAVLLLFVMGLHQSQELYAGWPDSSALSVLLHTQLRDGSGRYLAEDIEVSRYDARDITEAWQWNGPYYFAYQTADGRQLYGDPALSQAIKDRYYSIVELSFIYQPDTAFFAAEQMAESRNYDLIATIPFRDTYGSAYYFVWRSALVPGGGNFTSLAQLGF
jgi:Dolichyl-phosphate-mannose-protein mannosyltransferase